MKTIKTIFWLAIILIVTYIILIFVKPVLADNIAETLGIKSFNEKLRIMKKGVDIFSTKIPSKKELEESYSGAKNKIKEIKENIDNIRETANDLEDKYKEAKEFIDETGEKIDKVKNSLDDLKKVSEDITNIINTGAVK